MSAKKWRHEATFVHSKGKIKVTCGCGKQSEQLVSLDDAEEWHTQHTKLVERGRRK